MKTKIRISKCPLSLTHGFLNFELCPWSPPHAASAPAPAISKTLLPDTMQVKGDSNGVKTDRHIPFTLKDLQNAVGSMLENQIPFSLIT